MAANFAELDQVERVDLSKRTLPMDDTPELRKAIEEGEIHTLLMTYVHVTGDEEMLDKFAPHIKSPYAYPPESIPAELQQELREKLLHVLVTPGASAGDPSEALMHRMMGVGLAEEVADEFLPLLYDQIGLKPEMPRKERPGRKPADPNFKVLVIGAGMTGLAAGVRLNEAGYDWEIVEKNEEIGGTWWENRYPGVGVDTPSHFYSFSFALNPEWNNYHPQGNDMFAYLKRVTDDFGLRPNIRFNTAVEKLVWDDEAAVWNVTVRKRDGSEEVLRANAVINGHGPVNRYKWPNIPGLESFEGPRLHTATWDTSIDLTGKRVGVIGTGASAAQLIPAVSDTVDQLFVFQRSRHWVMPSPAGEDLVTDGVKFAMRHIPHYLEWYRFRIYWFAADGLYPNVLLDPEWPKDSPSVSAVNEAMRQFAVGHIERTFAERPDLKEKLTPDFPVFSKRIILDRGPYFTTYLKSNVHLEQGGIECITPKGIKMKDGREIELDVLVCATGFDVANMMGNLEIVGRGGKRLRDEWGTEDPRAYFGMLIPGFPNYFHTVGPNSAPNHAAGQNLISERQVNYAIECLDWINAEGKKAIEPSQMAFEAWQDKVDDQMVHMIWSHPRAYSYYNNSKKRNFLSWPWRLIDFWNACSGPRKDDMELS
ncbi:cation diffusion facilitator CzcD-associated flavoprotein CzcO [Sphingobium sp. OAS761]|uniref:flavin-containing monooxygenase n=1 Tax=Sphingobium sp. OAS761 TaxID=2817901 RepID=UPI0020A17CF3|nr:NAD(P)/FAD-dependent oxidoreductase [Sphingobium sp. OAS761]MCP1470311.1 cation diffusion facilitator CzcD-associated flavoprotein CzcO [Sphingobium sp. OAS761]